MYDYCVDDPVSLVDPAGLMGAVIEQGVKYAGKSIGKSFFNEELSSSERMFDVRNRIIENEIKIEDNAATDADMEQLEKDRTEENELWKKYGSDYEGSRVYRPYFPDDGYGRRKREEVRNK